MSLKIMLADDHGLVREGIKQLLEMDEDFVVVGEAANGIECLEKIWKLEVDVLLLDINMPQKNGFEVLAEVKKNKYRTKVILLTVHNSSEYLLKAVDMGADGYVLKDSEIAELKEAIHLVANGNKYIQPSLVPILNSKLVDRDEDSELVKSLTNREIEVLKLITLGNINKEIGIKLNISERTVKNHIFNIFKKINVNDRTQAAIFAIKNNLVKM